MDNFDYKEYLKNNPLLNENIEERVDVEREAGPVVQTFVKELMEYFNTHHDDIYDMNNFLTALDQVKGEVTKIRDDFQLRIGTPNPTPEDDEYARNVDYRDEDEFGY